MAKAVTFTFDKEDRVREKAAPNRPGKVLDRITDFNDKQQFIVRLDNVEGPTLFYNDELEDEPRS